MSLKGTWKLCAAAALSAGCMFAVTAPIGVASALGTFTLNDTPVEGNANVFDGALIRTTGASSRIYLHTGSQLTLGVNSSATFYNDHVVLAEGATRIDGMKAYTIQAAGYKIESAGTTSEAVVRLSDGSIQIAAMLGAVNVYNSKGSLLTRVAAGTASSFDAAAAGPSPSPSPSPKPQNNSGQSGATAGGPPSGATTGANANPSKTKLYVTLGVAMAGLGLATDAILQPGSGPTPTSP